LVAAGVGVAFSPETVRIFEAMGFECRALADVPKFELHSVWRRENNSPLLPAFLKILRECAREGDKRPK